MTRAEENTESIETDEEYCFIEHFLALLLLITNDETLSLIEKEFKNMEVKEDDYSRRKYWNDGQYIYKQLNENPYRYDVEDVKAMALLDISKSLAVIADNLDKEDKNND